MSLYRDYDQKLNQAIFDNLNIKQITVIGSNRKAKPEFYEMISNYSSLRSVVFRGMEDVDVVVDLVKTNQNVRQWVVYFIGRKFTSSVLLALYSEWVIPLPALIICTSPV